MTAEVGDRSGTFGSTDPLQKMPLHWTLRQPFIGPERNTPWSIDDRTRDVVADGNHLTNLDTLSSQASPTWRETSHHRF